MRMRALPGGPTVRNSLADPNGLRSFAHWASTALAPPLAALSSAPKLPPRVVTTLGTHLGIHKGRYVPYVGARGAKPPEIETRINNYRRYSP